jgi:hypothetical protein
MVYSMMLLLHQSVLYFRNTILCTVQSINLTLFTTMGGKEAFCVSIFMKLINAQRQTSRTTFRKYRLIHVASIENSLTTLSLYLNHAVV